MRAGHSRVSTTEQKQGLNIASHVADIERLSLQLDGKPIDKWFLEDGISGETLDRPVMNELREDQKSGLITEIIEVHPDRISRDQADQLNVLKERDQYGIVTYFTSQPGIETLTGSAKIATRGVNALLSELEKQRILERTTSARLNRVRSGNIMTSRPPYGLTYVKHDKDAKIYGHFILNPLEIENLKLILGWAKDGWSQRRIVQELFNRKIPTRTGKTAWQRSTIAKILGPNLETYAGTWSYLKYHSVRPRFPTKHSTRLRSSRVLRDKSEWMKVPLPEELRIITPEDVELIRKKQQQNKTQSLRNTKYSYLLQKINYCIHCQGMNYSDNFHGTPCYRCVDRRRQFPNPPKCKGGSIRSATLDDAVWRDVKNLILQPDLIKEEAKKFVESKKDDKNTGSSVAVELQKSIKDLDKQTENIDDAVRSGLPYQRAQVQYKKIEEQRDQLCQCLKEELKNNDGASQIDYSQLTKDIDLLSKDLSQVLEGLTFEERQQLCRWMSMKVFVGDYRYKIEGSLPIYNSAKLRPYNADVGSSGNRQNNAVQSIARNPAAAFRY